MLDDAIDTAHETGAVIPKPPSGIGLLDLRADEAEVGMPGRNVNRGELA